MRVLSICTLEIGVFEDFRNPLAVLGFSEGQGPRGEMGLFYARPRDQMTSGYVPSPDFGRTVFMLIVLIVAWLARLYALDADSLWGDELFSLYRASQISLGRAWGMIKIGNHPPLYELGILHSWLKLGHNEFFLRFPSVFFGTLTVGTVYTLGKAVFSAKTGMLSALLLAISPLHIYYSREARMYALLACWITFEVYCLHKALHSSLADKYWLGFAFFATASLYTHYYAGFTLWALTGFMLMRLALDWDLAIFKRWMAASLGIAAMFSPWVLVLWLHLKNQPVPWIQPMPLFDLLQMPAYFFVRREVLPEKIWPFLLWVVWVTLASCIISLIWRSYKVKHGQGWLLVSSVAGTFLGAFLASMYKPLIVARYFTGISPLVCLLVACGISGARLRHTAMALGAILLAVSAFSSYKISTSCWQEDWRSVAAYIEAHACPGDIILLFFPIAPEFWRMPFDYYYDGGLPVSCFQGELADIDYIKHVIDNLEEPHARVWIVQSARLTWGGTLDTNVIESLSTTQSVLFRARFDDQIVLPDRAVDVLCLEVSRHNK